PPGPSIHSRKSAASTMFSIPGKMPRLPTAPQLPWHVYLLLAEAIFMVFKWILPSLCTAELCMRPHALEWSEMAWLFSGLFLLLAAARLATRHRDTSAERPRLRSDFKTFSH
ncbi:MAG TPA: hypothetical protein VK165_19275, partial [Azonexus sp.]|nr:hypothetical protein [Azonexus sp.]